MPYTWSQLKADVDILLGEDANRLGFDSLKAAWTLQAILELQSVIPELRTGHETVYHGADFVGEGFASRAVLPPGKLLDGYFVVPDATDVRKAARVQLTPHPWEKRMELVHGTACANTSAFISIDPQAYTFWVYPYVGDCRVVSLFWDGIKSDFQDDDDTPFDLQVAGAVAEYIKSKVAADIKNDPALSKLFMLGPAGNGIGGGYLSMRRAIAVDRKSRKRIGI